MQKLGKSLVLGATGAPLLLLCVQSVFLRWYADDFLYAAAGREFGVLGAQSWWFNNWSGRFAYTFFATGLLELGPRFASVVAIATIVAVVCVVARAAGLPLAFAAGYALFFGTPDVQQTSFWFTGMFTYVA